MGQSFKVWLGLGLLGVGWLGRGSGRSGGGSRGLLDLAVGGLAATKALTPVALHRLHVQVVGEGGNMQSAKFGRRTGRKPRSTKSIPGTGRQHAHRQAALGQPLMGLHTQCSLAPRPQCAEEPSAPAPTPLINEPPPSLVNQSTLITNKHHITADVNLKPALFMQAHVHPPPRYDPFPQRFSCTPRQGGCRHLSRGAAVMC